MSSHVLALANSSFISKKDLMNNWIIYKGYTGFEWFILVSL